jgi:hypothetical protein
VDFFGGVRFRKARKTDRYGRKGRFGHQKKALSANYFDLPEI